jgi:hypothetical protein
MMYHTPGQHNQILVDPKPLPPNKNFFRFSDLHGIKRCIINHGTNRDYTLILDIVMYSFLDHIQR